MKKGLFALICGILLLATTTSQADDPAVHASNAVNYTVAAYANANQAYAEAVRLARFKVRTSRRSFFGFGRRSRTQTITVAVGNDYPNTEWGKNYTFFGQYYAALARDYSRAGDFDSARSMAHQAYYYLYTAYQYEVDIAANGPDDTKPWAERAIPLLSQALAYISQLM